MSAKNNLKDHTNFKHSDEDLPSTSKCGKCEYSSDDEGDLNKHIQSNHGSEKLVGDLCGYEAINYDYLSKHMSDVQISECAYCDFVTHSKQSLDLHLKEKHTFLCSVCHHASQIERKHINHTCRVYIENPTFETLYTKEWLNRNVKKKHDMLFGCTVPNA